MILTDQIEILENDISYVSIVIYITNEYIKAFYLTLLP